MKKNRKAASEALVELDWKTESDLNTLIEAEKIRRDPKRMERVKVAARQRLEATASVIAEAKETT